LPGLRLRQARRRHQREPRRRDSFRDRRTADQASRLSAPDPTAVRVVGPHVVGPASWPKAPAVPTWGPRRSCRPLWRHGSRCRGVPLAWHGSFDTCPPPGRSRGFPQQVLAGRPQSPTWRPGGRDSDNRSTLVLLVGLDGGPELGRSGDPGGNRHGRE